ncbi:MAG: PDZ domain-containing protein [Pseudomonadota bacterium]
MKILKLKAVSTVVALALLFAGQAAAQSAEQNEQRRVEEVEYERRLAEAEERMAEAARVIAEITRERLPAMQEVRRRIQIEMGDKPRLGVTIGSSREGPVEGVNILGVTPGSAAADAGLRADDVITAVNGESMSAESSDAADRILLDFMSGIEDGDVLDIEYLRDGKVGKVEVEPRVIENQMFAFGAPGFNFRGPNNIVIPDAPGAGQFVFRFGNYGWSDMELIELNEGLGKYFGTDDGLLVVNAPEAKAFQLEDGDVIQKIDGRTPTSVRHALRILSSYQAGESLQLEIMRDKKKRTLDVAVPDDLSGYVPDAPRPIRPANAPLPVAPPAPLERT